MEHQKQVVLVTGGTGTVGRGVKELVASDPTLSVDRDWVFIGSSDANLSDFASTKALFDRVQPTHVLHLAAVIMARHEMAKRKGDVFTSNLDINQNVLKCAQLHGIKKLVSCLTSNAYPAARLEDVLESELHSGPPPDPVSGYAHAKRMLDFMTKCMREQHGLDFVTVTPTNIFGTTAQLRLDGPLFEANLAKCLAAKSEGTPYKVWGTGKPQRQLLYSKDLAKMLVWALDNYSDPETLNFAGTEVSIRQVVETIAKACNFEGQMEFMTDKPDGPLRVAVSDAKFQKLWPEFKATPFEDAVKEVVKDHLKNV